MIARASIWDTGEGKTDLSRSNAVIYHIGLCVGWRLCRSIALDVGPISVSYRHCSRSPSP